jgi:phosphate transport system substrate-binding protein
MSSTLRSKLLVAAGLVLLLVGASPAAAQEAPPAEEEATVEASSSGQVSAQAVDAGTKITGIGATFPLNIYEQWKADVKKDPKLGFTVEYSGQGSGAGRNAYINNTADFGASDVPMSASETTQANDKRGGVVYVVTTSGGIAIGYNKSGVSDLQLTANQIGDIFMGNITTWGQLLGNSDSTPVQPVVRSDSSGTSNAFTTYLSKASTTWTRGTQNTVTKPANGSTGNGNDGVATAVKATAGAIGYMEVSFANERSIPIAKVRNAAGNFRTPNDANAVTDAVGDAVINEDRTVTMNYTTAVANAYPMASVSYLLAPPKMDATKGDNLKAFLTYGLSAEGQSKAGPLGYAPLPPRLVALGQEQVAKINPQTNQATTTTTVAAGRVAETTSTTAAPVATAAAAAPTNVTNTSTVANVRSAGTSRTTTTPRVAAAATSPENPGPLAKTGGEHWALAVVGLLLMAGGTVGRRRLARH